MLDKQKALKNTKRLVILLMILVLGLYLGFVLFTYSKTNNAVSEADILNNIYYSEAVELRIGSSSNIMSAKTPAGYVAFDKVNIQDNVIECSKGESKYYFLIIDSNTLFSKEYKTYMFKVM